MRLLGHVLIVLGVFAWAAGVWAQQPELAIVHVTIIDPGEPDPRPARAF